MSEWDNRLRRALSEPCPLPDGLRRATRLRLAREIAPPAGRGPLLALLALSVTAGLLEMLLAAALAPHPWAALPLIGYGMTTLTVCVSAAVFLLVPGTGPLRGRKE